MLVLSTLKTWELDSKIILKINVLKEHKVISPKLRRISPYTVYYKGWKFKWNNTLGKYLIIIDNS